MNNAGSVKIKNNCHLNNPKNTYIDQVPCILAHVVCIPTSNVYCSSLLIFINIPIIYSEYMVNGRNAMAKRP